MSEGRARIPCPRCLKSRTTCYCGELRPIRTALQFVLLQHPRERRKTIGTARMAHLCVENSRLIAGFDFKDHPEVDRLIADPGYHCVVLYPGPGSRNVDGAGAREPVRDFPADRKLLVFVLDGSWACAGKMLRRSPNLMALPRICFTPENPSEYKIRRQPARLCLSTLEAVHRVLEVLDPAADGTILLELFRKMVEFQLAFSSHGLPRRHAEGPRL